MTEPDEEHKPNPKSSRGFFFVFLYAAVILAIPLFISCQDVKRGYRPEYNPGSSDPHLSGTKYIDYVEDIPLPKGFYSNEEMTMIFDTPSGRIVEGYAVGKGKGEEILSFYEKTLPQLGWKQTLGLAHGGLDLRFQREGEQLRVNLKSKGLEVKMNKSGEYDDEYRFQLKNNTAEMTIKFSLYPNEE